MDYNRSNVASRERSVGQAAKPNQQINNDLNEDLLHDWKSFRETVRDKVGKADNGGTTNSFRDEEPMNKKSFLK